jgi:hypothetical protein
MENRRPLGFNLIRIASIYMLSSVVLGLYMGVTHSFTLITVHSHMALLGWATMALAGVIYVADAMETGFRWRTSGCTTSVCRS